MSNEENHTKDTEQLHEIKAYEAIWVTTTLRYNRSVETFDVVDETLHDAAESTEYNWTYDCTCGESFNSIELAEQHVKEAIGE